MRMPDGWDGAKTIEHLWQQDPQLQVVVCTAYSDYSWDELLERLQAHDRLLILKKPFDNIEVQQMANTLLTKWQMTERASLQMHHLEHLVDQRTAQLRAGQRRAAAGNRRAQATGRATGAVGETGVTGATGGGRGP